MGDSQLRPRKSFTQLSNFMRRHSPSGRRDSKIDPYRGLNAQLKDFRLLEVHPGSDNDPLTTTLRPASFASKQAPSYETISYCWGDPLDRVDLQINHGEYRRPRTAVEAIRRVRLLKRKRTIWIDAICINQIDAIEKVQQVLLMKEIYARSKGNLIYLGEEDETTAVFAERFSSIKERFKDGWIQQLWATYGVLRAMTEASLVPAEKLYSRPWFRRLWVVQEALLAPSNLCLCGKFEFQLLDLLRYAVVLRHLNPDIFHSYRCRDSRLYACWLALEPETRGPDRFTENFFDLLDTTVASREVTDERDRVYGVLGLLKGEIPKSLMPDYSRPVVDVIADATRRCFIFKSGLNLAVLRRVNHLSQEEVISDPWPSWIPRWERHEDAGPAHLYYEFRADRCDGRTSDAKFAELSDQEYSAILHPSNPHQLSLRGYLVGSIEAVSLVLSDKDFGDGVGGEMGAAASLRNWLEDVLAMISSKLMTTYINGIDFKAALTTAVLAGGESLGHPDPKTVVHLQRLIQYLGSDEFRRHVEESHHIHETYWMYNDTTTLDVRHKLMHDIRKVCRRRAFMLTTSGHPGIGPAMTQRGDKVVVLRGGSWPFILRPVNDGSYRIVGASYFQGMMDGEIVGEQMMREEEPVQGPQTFVLS